MIVCLCKGISDKKIRWLIQNGSTSVKDLMSSCQAGGDCGSCILQMKELISKESQELHETDATGS